MSSPASDDSVLSCSDIAADVVERLLGRYGIAVEWLAAGTPIAGTFGANRKLASSGSRFS
jgi:hypothetical protein